MARGKSPVAVPKVSSKVEPSVDHSKIDYSYDTVRANVKDMTDEEVVKNFLAMRAVGEPWDRDRAQNKLFYWTHERLKREKKLHLIPKKKKK